MLKILSLTFSPQLVIIFPNMRTVVTLGIFMYLGGQILCLLDNKPFSDISSDVPSSTSDNFTCMYVHSILGADENMSLCVTVD